jgi:hypothetical protein
MVEFGFDSGICFSVDRKNALSGLLGLVANPGSGWFDFVWYELLFEPNGFGLQTIRGHWLDQLSPLFVALALAVFRSDHQLSNTISGS